MNIWDKIWDKDIYSKKKVRNRKSAKKLEYFINLGVDFENHHKIVDFGAGGGYVTLELLRLFPNLEAVLMDNSYVGLKKAKTNLRKCQNRKKFFKRNLNYPIDHIDQRFDLAIAFSILEHLENIEQGINTIYRSLKTNGEVVMIWSNKKSVFYLQHKIWDKLKLWRYGLTKEMTDAEICSLISDRFIILSKSIEPCIGDKGLLTLLDKLTHKCSKKYGRYIYLHLQKVG